MESIIALQRPHGERRIYLNVLSTQHIRIRRLSSCQRGHGFRLTRFISRCKTVLKRLPVLMEGVPPMAIGFGTQNQRALTIVPHLLLVKVWLSRRMATGGIHFDCPAMTRYFH